MVWQINSQSYSKYTPFPPAMQAPGLHLAEAAAFPGSWVLIIRPSPPPCRAVAGWLSGQLAFGAFYTLVPVALPINRLTYVRNADTSYLY
jgi:hypothetical protein